MNNIFYIRRNLLGNYIRVVPKTFHCDPGISTCTELLLQIEPGGKELLIRTRSDITPIQAAVTIELTARFDEGLAQTISFLELGRVLRYLPSSEFIGFEVLVNNLRIFSANQISILDEEPEFAIISENYKYEFKSSEPETLLNYFKMPEYFESETEINLKQRHGGVIKNTFKIAQENHHLESTVFLLKQTEHGLFIELQSEEVFASFCLSTQPSGEDFKSLMSFEDFKAFKNIVGAMLSARIDAVRLYPSVDKMILCQNTIMATIACIGLEKTFLPPAISQSQEGWIQECPDKLRHMLVRLGISSKKIDDVVKLTVCDNKLSAFIDIEAMAAERELQIDSSVVQRQGPVFEVKRKSLLAALQAFPIGQYVRIFGILTEGENITIRSTVSEDFVLLAKMRNVSS
ncbi:hypothetical protein QWY20_17390 [Alkalimonas sp. MEB108]|uniref:Uncharacterized protein n=1 Tax=Alkalimonas cellulosilytica TaxID=3058395 RepID=A0ABU7JB56_9GAMM|nr:hypothetical protein [Alkalimonas sp. MEB108]MEE2003232.1 hypothetical protein [Alkalimonas sp. MEB108]